MSTVGQTLLEEIANPYAHIAKGRRSPAGASPGSPSPSQRCASVAICIRCLPNASLRASAGRAYLPVEPPLVDDANVLCRLTRVHKVESMLLRNGAVKLIPNLNRRPLSEGRRADLGHDHQLFTR